MIEFKALAMKADTDELHTIFLLRKNVQSNIIKIILGYLLIVAPETLKEWKVVIISVGQEYKSTQGRNNYKTGTGTTYGGRGQPMDIEKSNNNFKDRKPKCFNCNKYDHMVKECWNKKKEKETRKCFKCDKEGHIMRECKEKQVIKKQKIQEESDDKDDKEKIKKQGFGEDLK